MTSDIETRREHLRCELEAARREFHDMAASISEPLWAKPSHNPGWTNGQLLFHVLLGFILVLPLAGILVFFGHLPAACSRIFAAILNFSTPLFNRINAAGLALEPGRLAGRASSASSTKCMTPFSNGSSLCARATGALTMHYPTRWDRTLRRSCTWRTSSAIRLTTFGITDTSCGPSNETGKAFSRPREICRVCRQEDRRRAAA